MTAVVDALVALPPWLVLLLVFLLPAAEAGLLVGVFIPGETAVLVGGVAAHAGALDLWMVVAAASLGAALGDQAGFELGRRYGVGLAGRLPARVRQSGDLERTKAFLRRRGGAAVALGRWVAVLRALVPPSAHRLLRCAAYLRLTPQMSLRRRHLAGLAFGTPLASLRGVPPAHSSDVVVLIAYPL